MEGPLDQELIRLAYIAMTTFRSNGINVSDKTVGAYIVYLMDAFFISKAERYDIKGKNILLPLLSITLPT